MAKEIADLPPTHSDVARGHIGVRANVAEELGHKRLAKAHHLVVGFPLWIEIRATFAAAHRQARERILKNLFECEEFDDAGRDRWVKTQAALVRAERAVHLDAIPAVYLDLALVVYPRNAELNHPLRLNKTFKDFAVSIFFIPLNGGFDGLENLGHCLEKLRLVRVTFLDDLENFLD